jgi:hypothetical protein
MKKLMVVAAIAAMIGEVKAVDYYYDFTATLTTTTGKEGNEIKTTHYVGLGKDNASNTWWYDDPQFVETADGKFKTADIGGKTVNALKKGNKQYPWKINTSVIKTDEAKEELALMLGYVPFAPVKKDKRGVTGDTDYNDQKEYKGKLVWCETFSFKTIEDAECYRVKGSKKISATIEIDDLCDDGTIIEANGDDYDFTLQFLNFFGSQEVGKANSVEALFTFDSDDSGYGNLDNADGTNFGFALAGQGTWKEKLFSHKENGANVDYWGVDSISGNIVGYLAAPDCEACCADESKALAFECDEDPNDRVENWDLPTAAYGTWTMKFNKKMTIEENF